MGEPARKHKQTPESYSSKAKPETLIMAQYAA